MQKGTVVAIWRKRAHGGPMDPQDRATLIPDHGIEGNADVGGMRQVTIVSRERWDRVDDDLGATVDPTLRRANVMISGVNLVESRGKTIQIGPCEVLIRGETKPCNIVEDGHPGLLKALVTDWGGGVYGEVVKGGTLRVGDDVNWVETAIEDLENATHE